MLLHVGAQYVFAACGCRTFVLCVDAVRMCFTWVQVFPGLVMRECDVDTNEAFEKEIVTARAYRSRAEA